MPGKREGRMCVRNMEEEGVGEQSPRLDVTIENLSQVAASRRYFLAFRSLHVDPSRPSPLASLPR
jgi:hypothetical protein